MVSAMMIVVITAAASATLKPAAPRVVAAVVPALLERGSRGRLERCGGRVGRRRGRHRGRRRRGDPDGRAGEREEERRDRVGRECLDQGDADRGDAGHAAGCGQRDGVAGQDGRHAAATVVGLLGQARRRAPGSELLEGRDSRPEVADRWGAEAPDPPTRRARVLGLEGVRRYVGARVVRELARLGLAVEALILVDRRDGGVHVHPLPHLGVPRQDSDLVGRARPRVLLGGREHEPQQLGPQR